MLKYQAECLQLSFFVFSLKILATTKDFQTLNVLLMKISSCEFSALDELKLKLENT